MRCLYTNVGNPGKSRIFSWAPAFPIFQQSKKTGMGWIRFSNRLVEDVTVRQGRGQSRLFKPRHGLECSIYLWHWSTLFNMIHITVWPIENAESYPQTSPVDKTTSWCSNCWELRDLSRNREAETHRRVDEWSQSYPDNKYLFVALLLLMEC